MADYIYLLENRLSAGQQQALLTIREIARSKGLTVFLVGGAVRDLTTGSPVRDLDVVVQGNALKLLKNIEKAGGILTGENEPGQALFVRFPGGVRMEVGSTLSVQFPKPGKPVVKAATILDDLRRRDFTANAMALSLNQGSYGLLMDPLNGVADIENRELRLVSNYGFIEDPVRMVRAQRYAARLGWQLEAKTQTRYETGKSEGYISAMGAFHRGYEAEEIVHEEDPLRVMRRLEAEGWMKVLAPAWGTAKANVAELEKLREAQGQLQTQGIHADASAAQFPLLTAKMSAKEVAELKKSFPRQGFVQEIGALEGEAKGFAAELGSKAAGTASGTWKLLTGARPEVVLWVAYSTKSAALQAKFKSFYTEWPQARQRLPYLLMQEMRIVPELPAYNELLEKLFFELMDGKLGTVEEMKAYLEPYSPPAPPPPVHLRRARATKKEAKAKSRKKSDPVEDGELADGANERSEPAGGAEARVAAPVAAEAGKKSVPGNVVGGKAVVAKAVVKVVVAGKTASAKVAGVKQGAVKAVAVKALPAKKAAVNAPGKMPAKAAGSKTGGAKPGAHAAGKKAVAGRAVAGKVVVGASKQTSVKAAKKMVAKKVAAKTSAKASGKTPSKAPIKTPAKTGAKNAAKNAGKNAAKKIVPAKKIVVKASAKKVIARKTVSVKKPVAVKKRVKAAAKKR